MLNYYDDRNKEEDSLLDEQITMEIDSRSGNSGNMYNWKITRRRTKEYKYVGMDRATAKLWHGQGNGEAVHCREARAVSAHILHVDIHEWPVGAEYHAREHVQAERGEHQAAAPDGQHVECRHPGG